MLENSFCHRRCWYDGITCAREEAKKMAPALRGRIGRTLPGPTKRAATRMSERDVDDPSAAAIVVGAARAVAHHCAHGLVRMTGCFRGPDKDLPASYDETTAVRADYCPHDACQRPTERADDRSRESGESPNCEACRATKASPCL